MARKKFILICLTLIFGFGVAQNDTDVEEMLDLWEIDYSDNCKTYALARWAYLTNVTQETAEQETAAKNLYEEFQAKIQDEIRTLFPNFEESEDLSPELKRELRYLGLRGPADMFPEDIEEMNRIQSYMTTAYAEATVCDYHNSSKCDLYLEPDIEEKLRTATDYDELAYYWNAWHDAISERVSARNYTNFINLQNALAVANGFGDISQMWLAPYYDAYEKPPSWATFAREFKSEMKSIWGTLKPYYNILHAYVRMRLRANPNYSEKINRFGRIPANLMGNMWSQHWTNLDESTKPFPNAPSIDHSVTQAMVDQGYNATHMFRVSDDFFGGLGLEKMTDSFWELSMLEKPEDGRSVVCHASAHDFCKGSQDNDYRIKQCTVVTMKNLVVAHHEMGHVEYFMQYANHRIISRQGANPSFHEAIGDALALAVSTPKHLKCELGLFESDDVTCDEPLPKIVTETDINFLYYMALDKIAFFPFAISMDSWRWDVVERAISEADYNRRWWELRAENQGIIPPSGDRDASKFDPAAKYHIVANVEYIRYFISYILQFQLYESMCIAAGQFDPNDPESPPLYQCDFARNQAAGELIGNMMALGASKSWPEALEAITGSRELSTRPLLNYFQPLFDHLNLALEEEGEFACFGSECEEYASKYLTETYEIETSEFCRNATEARWNYQTDLGNDEAAEIYRNVTIAYANYRQSEWENVIRQFEYESFNQSGSVYRQLQFLNAVGTAALDPEDLEQFTAVVSDMSKIYGEAKICPYTNQDCNLATEGIPLEPNMEAILSKMEDYYEMAYIWKEWRDASGKNIRGMYNNYIDLSNKAADKNGYANMGDFWLMRYESETFKDDVNAIWAGLKDFYEELHAFVRFRLNKKFPEISLNDPLPAHILGNMWGQTWNNVYNLVIPYPDDPALDITPGIENFPSIKFMFELANNFFKNAGLNDMAMSFGDKAIIEKPIDRELICHASAWDFCDGEDFRVKMCTNKNMDDFFTVYHELGHIQYYTAYKDLPITFRTGANPGFHEAIGDVIALSVNSPSYLYQIGLIDDSILNANSTINMLMKMALSKVAFIPFGLMIDSYRWQLFDGTIPRENMTYNWLKMRNQFQGIVPPIQRNEEDFDAGAKYHVPADVEYLRYFVSHILQFTIFKQLCTDIRHRGPLHECNFNFDKEAGATFMRILEAGASRNWQELLEEITGDGTLNVAALNEYFEPLKQFLVEERNKEGYPKGWDDNAFEKWFGDDDTLPTPGPTTTTTTTTTTQSPGTGDPGTSPTPPETSPPTEDPGQDTTQGTTPEATDPPGGDGAEASTVVSLTLILGMISFLRFNA